MQRIAAIDQRPFMVGPQRQHAIITRHALREALHLAAGIPAIEKRIGEIRTCSQRLVIAGQRLFEAAHILEDVSVIEQRFGNAGADLKGAPDQRQRFGVAPLLRPHHAQQMPRREGFGRGIHQLQIQPFGFRQLAALVRAHRLFVKERQIHGAFWDLATVLTRLNIPTGAGLDQARARPNPASAPG